MRGIYKNAVHLYCSIVDLDQMLHTQNALNYSYIELSSNILSMSLTFVKSTFTSPPPHHISDQ